MCGHRDKLVFLPLLSAHCMFLLNSLNRQSGLRGDDFHKGRIVVRKRTNFIILKDESAQKLLSRVNGKGEIGHPPRVG